MTNYGKLIIQGHLTSSRYQFISNSNLSGRIISFFSYLRNVKHVILKRLLPKVPGRFGRWKCTKRLRVTRKKIAWITLIISHEWQRVVFKITLFKEATRKIKFIWNRNKVNIERKAYRNRYNHGISPKHASY